MNQCVMCESVEDGSPENKVVCMDLCRVCHDYLGIEINGIESWTPDQLRDEYCYRHFVEYRHVWNKHKAARA